MRGGHAGDVGQRGGGFADADAAGGQLGRHPLDGAAGISPNSGGAARMVAHRIAEPETRIKGSARNPLRQTCRRVGTAVLRAHHPNPALRMLTLHLGPTLQASTLRTLPLTQRSPRGAGGSGGPRRLPPQGFSLAGIGRSMPLSAPPDGNPGRLDQPQRARPDPVAVSYRAPPRCDRPEVGVPLVSTADIRTREAPDNSAQCRLRIYRCEPLRPPSPR